MTDQKATGADVRALARGGTGTGKPFGGNKSDQVKSRTATWGTCEAVRAESRKTFRCDACLGTGGSETRKTAIVIKDAKGIEKVVGERCAVALADLGRLTLPA